MHCKIDDHPWIHLYSINMDSMAYYELWEKNQIRMFGADALKQTNDLHTEMPEPVRKFGVKMVPSLHDRNEIAVPTLPPKPCPLMIKKANSSGSGAIEVTRVPSREGLTVVNKNERASQKVLPYSDSLDHPERELVIDEETKEETVNPSQRPIPFVRVVPNNCLLMSLTGEVENIMEKQSVKPHESTVANPPSPETENVQLEDLCQPTLLSTA